MITRFNIYFTITLIGICCFIPRVCEAKRNKNVNKAAAQEQNDPELYQLIAADFPRWDADHNGILSADEINALIENPQVTGAEAAAIVLIRKNYSQDGDDESAGFTQAQLLAKANEHPVQREFSRDTKRIGTINHSLFLPGDPNLMTFHQGRVGDCYLLAVTGAFVARDPQSVRTMIKPLPNAIYEVDFASGKKITVANATDAELLQGAKMGVDHGIWLGILEKAYANIRETNRKTGAANEPSTTVPRDFLGGGRPGPVIEQLTGHKSAGTPLTSSANEDLPATVRRVHELLIKLTHERRLVVTGTSKNAKLPPKIPHGHVFGVLAYEPTKQIVRVFNPWGNEFTPAGPSGVTNGYLTHHGIFDMPLSEFVQTFKTLTFETDRPLND